MNYQFDQNIQLGCEIALLSEYLPKSLFPRKVARVEIKREEGFDDPRVWMTPMWHFVSFSRSYGFSQNGGHDHNASNRTHAMDIICQHFGVKFNYNDDLEENSISKLEQNASRKGIIKPLFYNYHSGELSTGDLVGQHCNGYAYISLEEIQDEYGDDENARQLALNYLQGELDLYNYWVTGDVWYFMSYDENGEVVDSSGGYYGESENDFQYIKECAGVTPDTVVVIED